MAAREKLCIPIDVLFDYFTQGFETEICKLLTWPQPISYITLPQAKRDELGASDSAAAVMSLDAHSL